MFCVKELTVVSQLVTYFSHPLCMGEHSAHKASGLLTILLELAFWLMQVELVKKHMWGP